MKIVVISPHRDDAAFSLSLTIEAWLGQGHKIEVINCFTRSEYAPFSDADSLHPNDRLSYVTAVRSREDESWRRQFGARLTLTDLNIKDAPLRLHCAVDEVCTLPVNPVDKAFAKMNSVLHRTVADAFVLPLALGRHVDHLTARDATLAVETIADRPWAFYEDLPYASRPGAAETLEFTVAQLAETLPATSLTPRFVTDPEPVKDAVARKRRAALCYDSQIEDAVTDDISQFCIRYAGRERLWVNDLWRSATQMTEGKVNEEA